MSTRSTLEFLKTETGSGLLLAAAAFLAILWANSPWAAPGAYTVRLTVNGKSYTQPLTLKLDPRVKTPAAGLAQLASLSKEMYDGAVAAHAALVEGRALSQKLAGLSGADAAVLKARIDSIAPPPQVGGRGRGRGGFGGGRGRGGAPAGPPTLESVSNAQIAAAAPMQEADVTPTAAQVAAVARARADAKSVMERWNLIKTRDLAAFNAKQKAAGQPTVTLPAGTKEADSSE